MEGADAVNPGAWVRHTASMRGRMTDDERRGLDRLTHHATRLALLIELLGGSDRVVGVSAGSQYLAFELYRKTRNELRREYDVLEHRTWSKAEAIVATALKASYVALSSGSVLKPQTILGEATRARRVLDEAVRGMQRLEGD